MNWLQRRRSWAWDTNRELQLIGKTDAGQLAIRLLEMNHERRIKIRQAERLFGLFPPQPLDE